MKLLTRPRIALVFLLVIGMGMVCRGMVMLQLPPIYRQLHPYISTMGYLLLVCGIGVLCFYRWIVSEVLWIFEKATRWISALLMAGAIGIDAMMHVLSIPHMEGWWLPVVGSGALVTALSERMTRWFKKT